MREGLRSQVQPGNVSGGGRVGRMERVGLKDEAFDLGAEGLEEPNLTIEKKDGVENAVKEEFDLDLNVSASKNVDLAESVSNKSCFSGGDSIVEADFDRKGKKEQHSNDEVLIDGRVLRTRTMWSDDKRSYNEEDGRVCSMNNRGHGGSERIRVGEEYDEAGEYFSDSYENERTKVKKEEKGERKLKRKRGRPPKMQSKDEDQLVDQSPCKMESKDEEADDERTEVKKEGKDKKKLKRKRGRPPKMQSKDEDQLDDQSPRKMESKDEKADECKSKLKRKRGRPPKMKSKDEEADKYFSDSYENERTKVKKEGKDKSKLKRKRGRPPKMEPKNEAAYVRDSYENERTKVKKEGKGNVTLKRKRGRPPKMGLKNENQLIDQSPLKCGRAPKAGGQNSPNGFLAVVNDKKGKVGLRKGEEGLTMKDSAIAIDDTCSGRSPGEELVKKSLSPVKKDKIGKNLETKNNVVGSSSRSNTVSACDAGITARRLAKQFVRDEIMERLSAAGWEVDYRPRNGREYCDAVYVSLDKKTHWSITLAYNRLKKHYEAGDGEGTVYGPGFIFTPIPEEDFNMLTKVVNKTRNDKAKKRGKGGKTVVRVNRKESKGQPCSGSGMRKSVKRKMKMKRSFLKEGNTDVRSSNRMPVLVRDHKRHRTQKKKQCALLVRNAEEEIDSGTDGYVPYSGKRTLLSWMIDLGTVVQNGKVHYMQYKKEHALLNGKITGDGIHCGCCDKIVTISDFEAHAGSKHSDPLKKIYTEGGTSLLQCLLDSWNKQEDSERKGFHFVDVAGEDPNDDTCGVCGDGGDLICCDGCPSTFHQSCLGIKKFPSGDWHCIYCCCKFCGLVGGSSNNMDCSEDFTLSKLLTCHLCEEKYHRSCIESNAAKTDDSWDAFCGNKCQKLSERLEMLLGVKHEIEDGFSWTFIRRSDVGFDASEIETQMVESNSKLAVALSVMDECFMPYIDHKSGINLIHSIMYNRGSNFKRLNYSGFVTAILERGDEIISAASIRIHGNKLAEMPFIGTRYMYRRQGMCRRLLNAIEWALSSLNVELLVIPAISELRETWTSVFGFEPLESTNKQIVSNMSLLVFPHVDMLQKNISEDKVADENLLPTEVSNLKKNGTIYNVANNCDGMGSPGSVLIDSTDILPSNACERNDKTISSESSCWLLNGSNKASDITGSTMHTNSPKDVICQVVCQTGHENLAVKDKSAANACDYATDTHCVAEDVIACRNISCDCVILNHGDKRIDLGSQLNKCCIPSEGRKCLSLYCSGTEATAGHDAGALLEVTKKFPIEVKVDEIVTNNNCAENAAPCGAESIHLDLQIVCSTSEPKDSADGICHDSDNNGMRSKNRSVQPDFVASEVHVENCGSHSGPEGDCASGEAVLTMKDLPLDCENVSSVNAQNVDEPELSLARTGLETNIYPADCQSMPVSSGICEKNVGGVSERSNASGVVEADLLPADTDKVSDSKPCMKGSSELAESDLQIEQSARSNVPYLRSPNTASGAALLCASAGSTSCGSTEGIVLSNQAS